MIHIDIYYSLTPCLEGKIMNGIEKMRQSGRQNKNTQTKKMHASSSKSIGDLFLPSGNKRSGRL